MFWRKSHHRHNLKQLLDSRKSVNELPKTKNNYKFQTLSFKEEHLIILNTLKPFQFQKYFTVLKKAIPI